MNQVLWHEYYMHQQADTWTQIVWYQNMNCFNTTLLTGLNNPTIEFPDIKNKQSHK